MVTRGTTQNTVGFQINDLSCLGRRQIIVSALMLVLCLSGCGAKGPKLFPVSGRVTFQSKPVSAGKVRFSNPPAGVDILADLQPDGAYHVRMANSNGLPEGNYGVAVVPPSVDVPVGAPAPPPATECRDIPARYRNPETSGLTWTVKSGNSEFNIDMRP
jgi:predicted small lipoprotein YifL